MRFLAIVMTALCLAGPALARDAAPLAQNEAVEKRLIRLAEDLRCLVCQNQSLAESHADLAEDLRREVRGLIEQGKSDAEIKDFLVSRYGDFVLYQPPVKPTTWLLWAGPFVLLVVGVAVLIVYLRRRGSRVEETPLTEEDRRRAEALLKDEQ